MGARGLAAVLGCLGPGALPAVVAPPAASTPRSQSSHSTRVFDAIATRSSRPSPSESSPAAIAFTRSPACRHVIDRHSSPTGYRYASRSGVSWTRLARSCAMDFVFRVSFSGATHADMGPEYAQQARSAATRARSGTERGAPVSRAAAAR